MKRTTWLIVSLAFATVSLAADPEPPSPSDCGVNALFVLLELDGHPVALDRIERGLPPRRSDGYSMAELSTASRAVGFPLDGVRFGKGDPPLDRPAIAFFKGPRSGHFAILRPVGSTGTMVQVIDPPYAPQILDYDRLFAQTPWTGRVLIRRDPWLSRYAVSLTLAVLGAGTIMAMYRKHRRGESRRIAKSKEQSAEGRRQKAETDTIEVWPALMSPSLLFVLCLLPFRLCNPTGGERPRVDNGPARSPS